MSERFIGEPPRFSDTVAERLVAALKASRSGTWRWNIAEDVVEWDEALCEVYGIAPETAPKSSREFLALIHPDDREHAWSRISTCLEGGPDADYQFRAVVNNEVRWIYDRSALVRDAEGKPAYMMGACLDVTERRRIQEERDAALARQTLLLRELSHRVKNHLSMVVALLRLKGARQKDPAAKQDFERAIERVNTIASLHDQLFQAGEIDQIDVRTYVGFICDNLGQSITGENPIQISHDLESYQLPVDQALPLGLIVNEIVTNAVKYAFAPGQPGRIKVRFRVRQGRALLTVSDNGRGFGDQKPTSGVGTRLLRSLAQQIGARLRVVSRKGVTYSLSFTPAENVQS